MKMTVSVWNFTLNGGFRVLIFSEGNCYVYVQLLKEIWRGILCKQKNF